MRWALLRCTHYFVSSSHGGSERESERALESEHRSVHLAQPLPLWECMGHALCKRRHPLGEGEGTLYCRHQLQPVALVAEEVGATGDVDWGLGMCFFCLPTLSVCPKALLPSHCVI